MTPAELRARLGVTLADLRGRHEFARFACVRRDRREDERERLELWAHRNRVLRGGPMKLADLLDVAADAREAGDPRLPELLAHLGDAAMLLDVLRLPHRLELPSGGISFDGTLPMGFEVGVDADGTRFLASHGLWVDANLNPASPGWLYPGGYFQRDLSVSAVVITSSPSKSPAQRFPITWHEFDWGDSDFGAGAGGDASELDPSGFGPTGSR
jgi:hypothetical protein